MSLNRTSSGFACSLVTARDGHDLVAIAITSVTNVLAFAVSIKVFFKLNCPINLFTN